MYLQFKGSIVKDANSNFQIIWNVEKLQSPSFCWRKHSTHISISCPEKRFSSSKHAKVCKHICWFWLIRKERTRGDRLIPWTIFPFIVVFSSFYSIFELMILESIVFNPNPMSVQVHGRRTRTSESTRTKQQNVN